jgi:hypothetical protein
LRSSFSKIPRTVVIGNRVRLEEDDRPPGAQTISDLAENKSRLVHVVEDVDAEHARVTAARKTQRPLDEFELNAISETRQALTCNREHRLR